MTQPSMQTNESMEAMDDYNSFNYSVGDTESAHWLPLLRKILYWTLLAATGGGGLVNLFVIARLIRIIHRRPYLNPAVTLLAMTLSDLTCQCTLFTYAVAAQYMFHPDVPHKYQDLFCKTVIFLTHTTNSFSTWCWVVLSTLRYMAIFAPVCYNAHSSCQRPTSILVSVLLITIVLDCWLPAFTTFDRTGSLDCAPTTQASQTFLRSLYSLELVWTCFLPVLITVCMDFGLFICGSRTGAFSDRSVKTSTCQPMMYNNNNNNSIDYNTAATSNTEHTKLRPSMSSRSVDSSRSQSMQIVNASCNTPRNTASLGRRQTGRMMLKRYLILATVDLLMNIPHSLNRFLAMHAYAGITTGLEVFTTVAYLLYYGQFNINTLYLWVLCGPNSRRRHRSGNNVSSMRTIIERERKKQKRKFTNNNNNNNDDNDRNMSANVNKNHYEMKNLICSKKKDRKDQEREEEEEFGNSGRRNRRIKSTALLLPKRDSASAKRYRQTSDLGTALPMHSRTRTE